MQKILLFVLSVASFDASAYRFIYGQRYDYYDGGNVTINSDTANSLDGILKVNDSLSEGDIFVCYNEYHVAVRCTNDSSNKTTYDYGITYGDTWTAVGLEFYMHSAISSKTSDYYTSGTDFAIPAGTYYIYANISDAAKENYKFTYLGGTLTILPKVTSIELTSYSKEYKDTTAKVVAYDKKEISNEISLFFIIFIFFFSFILTFFFTFFLFFIKFGIGNTKVYVVFFIVEIASPRSIFLIFVCHC